MLLDPSKAQDWSIVTSLRGPDNENGWLKVMTTKVLRHYAGSLIANSISQAMNAWDQLGKGEQDWIKDSWMTEKHFASHVLDGAVGLCGKLPNTERKELASHMLWVLDTLGQSVYGYASYFSRYTEVPTD